MNKTELIRLIESLKLPPKEYYILAGGCLVLHGIKEHTKDLDLCVSMELFEKLKQQYRIEDADKNEYGFYSLSDLVEFVPNNKEDFTYEEFEDYQVEKLEYVLASKIEKNRPKDQEDIVNIKKYLLNNNNEVVHVMKLQPEYFEYIECGTKRIELRLNDEKRKMINVGDTIVFSKEPMKIKKMITKVVKLIHGTCFEELISNIDIELLADKNMHKEELLKILSKFYSEEEQRKYGVVGIVLEKIEN